MYNCSTEANLTKQSEGTLCENDYNGLVGESTVLINSVLKLQNEKMKTFILSMSCSGYITWELEVWSNLLHSTEWFQSLHGVPTAEYTSHIQIWLLTLLEMFKEELVHLPLQLDMQVVLASDNCIFDQRERCASFILLNQLVTFLIFESHCE